MNMEKEEMADQNAELKFSRLIKAAPEDVYYAFGTAQGWRDWMCDSARFENRAGGTYQLSWNSGWFAAGTVKEIERPERILLAWRGKDDPGYTEVSIQFVAEGDDTRVDIVHAGFGKDEAWESVQEESVRGWEIGLENLESIFDTGIDLRIARRPLLGIFAADFNEQIAKDLGVPTTKGVRIDRALEGLGAEKAGLKSSDVIIEMAGKAIAGFADFGLALQGKLAGEVIPVTFYRGPEKHTVDMELSGRKFEDFPLDPATMAERIRTENTRLMKDLRHLLDGVTEEEAEFSPRPEEWSVKEILAHLIDSERFSLNNITELMIDGQREYAGGDGDTRARLEVLLEMAPTIPELLERLVQTKEEVVSLLAKAEKLKRRKGVMWGLALGYLEYPNAHERNHMEQIKTTIAAARGA
jgi:uncharacterized protein YndB with AHSA1/START domain